MYCIMCGNRPLEGTVICDIHTPVFDALHDFVIQWERFLPKDVQKIILSAPYQYNPHTGKKYTEEED